MKSLTVRNQSVFLLHFAPNWAAPVKAVFRILSDSERGLTGREERVPLSSALRTELSFDLLLHRENASEFRAALRELGNTPVLCPFWPAAAGFHDEKTFYVGGDGSPLAGADGSFYVSGDSNETKTSRLSSGLMLCYEPDGSELEVYDAALAPSFSPSASAVKVPLLWGRFKKQPGPSSITDELSKIKISFEENSPFELALTAAAVAFADGPQAAGQTRPVFPLRPNWRAGLRFGESIVEIDTDDIGFGRETADSYYPHAASRTAAQQFLCPSWADIHTLIRFFSDSVGTVKNFWLPAFVGDCRLTAPTASGSATLQLDNAAGLGAASHLALISPQTVEPHGVDAIGADSVDLTEPTAADFGTGQTLVSPLLLARFVRPHLKITFMTDEVARATVRFVEVPEEYEELDGDDAGSQAETAWLYRFSLYGYDDWLFTSHERPIIHGADVYAPRHFDHGATRESINLEKNKLTITSRYFWHTNTVALRNPLGYFLPFRLESPMYISILECNPDENGDIASAETIFSGQVEDAAFNGPIIQAKCRNIGAIFARQIPTLLVQSTCNYAPYGPACGLDSNVWKMSATVVSYDGAHELIIGQPTFSDPGAPRPWTRVFDHFFAGGKLEAGNGNDFARRGILDSIAHGDNIKLTIRHPLEAAPDGIFIWAGCDGRSETCRRYHVADNPEGKFNNFSRFGAFPHVPSGNPTLAKIVRDHSNEGKK